MMTTNKEIKSLYIHIPFCSAICSYCDFTKIMYFRDFAIKYLKALNNELKQKVTNYHLDTIYVGGGTPTCLDDDLFLLLLKMIEPYSKYVKEYTFEANPESLNEEKIKMLSEYRVNRVSMGVESTDDKILKLLNRKHDFNDVRKAVNSLRNYNINNINVDLILGLPNVSMKLLKKDLDNLLSLNPTHISTYSLTVHENTIFYLKNIKEESEDESREKYDYIHETLLKNNYIHYEISNFAKEEHESLHNFTYWKNEQYYGIGLGASGYINNIRYTNTKSLNKYINNEYDDEKEIVNLNDEFEYQIMLNLRTNKGINLKYIKERFNIDLLENDGVKKHLKLNNLNISDNNLIPTYNGMMILDRIILDII